MSFKNVNMNKIPNDLRDFDFNWSSCALEHLGGIKEALNFICNNLDTLRSGGLAVHTTEFNLSSNHDTLNEPRACILREKDIIRIIDKLRKKGHYVYPLDLRKGQLPGDKWVDVPNFGENYNSLERKTHLRFLIYSYITTSIGLIIKKK